MSTPVVKATSGVPGWFGKLPALGDFASRRLPEAFVRGWDAWLQRELARSRAALGGTHWLDAFLVAPVRRYWIAGGLLGADAWIGVWMPSVDAAGRHYPFTIAAPLGATAVVGARALPADAAWFDALDTIARSVLDPARGVDDLEHALAAFAATRGAGTAADTTAFAAATAPLASGSLWWCAGAAPGDARYVADGLPEGNEFDRLLRPCP